MEWKNKIQMYTNNKVLNVPIIVTVERVYGKKSDIAVGLSNRMQRLSLCLYIQEHLLDYVL